MGDADGRFATDNCHRGSVGRSFPSLRRHGGGATVLRDCGCACTFRYRSGTARIHSARPTSTATTAHKSRQDKPPPVASPRDIAANATAKRTGKKIHSPTRPHSPSGRSVRWRSARTARSCIRRTRRSIRSCRRTISSGLRGRRGPSLRLCLECTGCPVGSKSGVYLSQCAISV
jgi:hypothetical protein